MSRRAAIGDQVRRIAALATRLSVATLFLLAPRAGHAQWYSHAFSIVNPTGHVAVVQGAEFGQIVAAMGHDVLVASPEDALLGFNQGTVFLFDGDTGALLRSFGNPGAPVAVEGSFGRALASVGGTVVIGSLADDTAADGAGAVYLFDASSGALLHTVTDPSPSSLGNDEHFGTALAIVDGMIAVGAPGKSSPGRNQGAVFIVDPLTGAIVRTLLNPTLPPAVSYRFGRALAALGGNLVVGGADELAVIDAVTGAVRQSVPNPNPSAFTDFGAYVGALGNQPVAGDPHGPNGGDIYTFDSTSGALVLTVPNPTPGVFVLGNPFAVRGADLIARSNIPMKERVALFDGGTGAIRQTYFNPSMDPVTNDLFASAMAATDTGFVIAAPGYGPRSSRNIGAVHVYDACGNGVRTAGEQCDDGNLAAGDGCSPTCTLELCGPAPMGGCRTVPTRKSSVVIGDNVKDVQDVITWKWSRGQQTLLTDFGTPLTTTSYALCVYDGSGASQPLRVSAALAGATWSAPTPTQLKYENPARTPSGVFRATLHAGPDGSASITVKGKGPRVAPPALPLTLPVTVQLRNSDTGVCWTATYGTTVTRNDALKFRATSD